MKNDTFKVLLINCNTMMDVLLPVGLSLISACLKEKGFQVKLFDTTFYKTAKETGDEARAKNLQVRKTNREEFGLVYKDTDLFDDLKKMVEEYNIPEENVFTDWKGMAKKKKFADALGEMRNISFPQKQEIMVCVNQMLN